MKSRKAIQTSVWGYYSGDAILKYGEVEKCSQMLVCAAFGLCNRISIAKSGFKYGGQVHKLPDRPVISKPIFYVWGCKHR